MQTARVATVIASSLLALLLALAPAAAEKRVALVVGNDNYANLPRDQQLLKAVNDANAIGDTLHKLGFEVLRGENLSHQQMADKFDDLMQKLSPGDTAFFFFAGHGVLLGGGNYILPVDVPNAAPGQESRLARAALSESELVFDLHGRGVRVAIVVLDACRNNPFRRAGARTIGTERGLARIDPVRGVFALYSAGIGQRALDRLSDNDPNPNSVFTRVLAPTLLKPGLDLGSLAVEVREEVAKLAGTVQHDQRPAYYDETSGGRVYLAGLQAGDALKPPIAPPPAVQTQPPDSDAAARADYALSLQINTTAAWEAFLRKYPSGFYADLARARLVELKKSQVAVVAPPVAPQVPTVVQPAVGVTPPAPGVTPLSPSDTTGSTVLRRVQTSYAAKNSNQLEAYR